MLVPGLNNTPLHKISERHSESFSRRKWATIFQNHFTNQTSLGPHPHTDDERRCDQAEYHQNAAFSLHVGRVDEVGLHSRRRHHGRAFQLNLHRYCLGHRQTHRCISKLFMMNPNDQGWRGRETHTRSSSSGTFLSVKTWPDWSRMIQASEKEHFAA